MARRYNYDIPSFKVPLQSEYIEGHLYVNGIQPGDRVIVIDDTISTGGTLVALLSAVQDLGAVVHDVVALVEKVDNHGVERVFEKLRHPRQDAAQDPDRRRPRGRPLMHWDRPVNLGPETETGLLVVVEGTDGSGKTTLVEAIVAELQRRGVPASATLQPTPSLRATEIFQLGLHNDASPDEYRALYLCTIGDRLYHRNTVLAPRLAAGEVVDLRPLCLHDVRQPAVARP